MSTTVGVGFALERFGWVEGGLEVVGRWRAERPRRLGVPRLVVVGADGRRRRLSAEAGRQVRAEPDGAPWRALFGWPNGPVELGVAELEVGADLVVELPLPEPLPATAAEPEGGRFAVREDPVVEEVDDTAALRAERRAAGRLRVELNEARGRAEEVLESLRADREEGVKLVDDLAQERVSLGRVREVLREETTAADELGPRLAGEREESEALARELAERRAETERLREELEAAGTLMAELEERRAEADRLRAELEEARAEVAALGGDLDGVRAGAVAVRAQLDDAQAELVRLRAAAAEGLPATPPASAAPPPPQTVAAATPPPRRPEPRPSQAAIDETARALEARPPATPARGRGEGGPPLWGADAPPEDATGDPTVPRAPTAVRLADVRAHAQRRSRARRRSEKTGGDYVTWQVRIAALGLLAVMIVLLLTLVDAVA